MARPKLAEKRKKFNLALNSIERDILKNAAEKECISISEFIRNSAINKAKEIKNND